MRQGNDRHRRKGSVLTLCRTKLLFDYDNITMTVALIGRQENGIKAREIDLARFPNVLITQVRGSRNYCLRHVVI